MAAYILGYLLCAKAAILAVGQLAGMRGGDIKSTASYEKSTYRAICLAIPLLTAGLALGSFWGERAWGDWWNFDPKELFSLATWLVFMGYLHFRYMTAASYKRANSVIVLLGFGGVVITLLWVNFSHIFAGLHSYAS